MSCIEQVPLWSGLELLLQYQLESRRGKVLLRHLVCRRHKSLMKIFTGKTVLPGLALYFSESHVQQGHMGSNEIYDLYLKSRSVSADTS